MKFSPTFHRHELLDCVIIIKIFYICLVRSQRQLTCLSPNREHPFVLIQFCTLNSLSHGMIDTGIKRASATRRENNGNMWGYSLMVQVSLKLMRPASCPGMVSLNWVKLWLDQLVLSTQLKHFVYTACKAWKFLRTTEIFGIIYAEICINMTTAHSFLHSFHHTRLSVSLVVLFLSA